jgi:8-oxo-dGTP pyrophosphatase MutT (NUDIX family)
VFPGGKVDNETLVEAARRELFEETGLTPHGVPSFEGYAEVYGTKQATKSKRYIDLFFLWKSWTGFPQRIEPDKCLSLRWFSFAELPNFDDLTMGTRQFVANILPKLLEKIGHLAEPEVEQSFVLLAEATITPWGGNYDAT